MPLLRSVRRYGLLRGLIVLLAASCCGTGCGESTVEVAAPPPPPVAAPVCPPGVAVITDISQVTDADRYNGTAELDLGNTPAGGSVEGDPRLPGIWEVTTQTVTVPRPAGDAGVSTGTLYVPSRDTVRIAAGQFPLVVVMPGYGATHTSYAAYSTLFASHGFVVLGLDTGEGGFSATSDHQQEARRTVAAIDWMLSQSPAAAMIDASKIAVSGHSKGGKVGFWAAALDRRIDLVVGWDPSNAGGPPCFIDPAACNSQPAAPNCNTPGGQGVGMMHEMHAETFIIGVPPDRFTNPEPVHNALLFYRGAPSPATYILLRGGHADFLFGNQKLVDLTLRASAGHLLTRLQGKQVDPAYLPGGALFDPDGLVTPPVRAK